MSYASICVEKMPPVQQQQPTCQQLRTVEAKLLGWLHPVPLVFQTTLAHPHLQDST